MGNGQNVVLFTYFEPRNTDKSILLAGIYSIINPYTFLLLPVGWKGYENILIPMDMEFNFIREKESYLINNFITQTTTKINKGE